MRAVRLAQADDFEGWRAAARELALKGVSPEDVSWRVGDEPGDLFAAPEESEASVGRFSVPKAFVALAEDVILHRDPERFSLLYTLLIRLRAEPGVIEDRADPLILKLEGVAREVRRDIHKMRAFLRFREIEDAEGPRFVAWFEPRYHIVRANTGFFARRFASMRWSILTPELSIHWDGAVAHEGPGAAQADAPGGDPIESVWKTYYASIFNPARLKTGTMLREMPRRYWKNMPETALIPELIAGAQARESRMIDTARRTPSTSGAGAWEALREEALGCTRCPLHRHATQTVFGEGPIDAALMLVGEQPGDQEDLQGRPFVGPAGQLLDRALAEARIDRSRTYVTNAVKHFKYEQRGKRRIHAKPLTSEIVACRWWIEQEMLIVRPQVTVALGATAARSLFGRPMTIGRERGRVLDLPVGNRAWITVHPSYLLRIEDKTQADEEYARFVEDLRGAAAAVA